MSAPGFEEWAVEFAMTQWAYRREAAERYVREGRMPDYRAAWDAAFTAARAEMKEQAKCACGHAAEDHECTASRPPDGKRPYCRCPAFLPLSTGGDK